MYKMSALLFIVIISASIVLTQDSRSSIKHYCFKQSPIDFSFFNLTTVQYDDIDSIVRINEFEHLRLHFCRPLKDPCNGKQDYAICLHSNDNEIGIGKEPPNIVIKSGKIMFSYTGDKCNKTHNYTVDVEMKCNFSIKKIDADLDIVYNRDQCSFQMPIETFAACSKRKQAKCDLRDKTGYYDLSPLINLGSNYVIQLNNSSSVILNVCHSLLYGHFFHQCDHETMVCLVDEINTEEPSYTRLGNVNDDMRFSTHNGTVHLDLTSDSPCDDEDGKGLKTIRTTIEFVCQKNATKTMPEYISGFETCHYKFRWLTTAACSEDNLIKQSHVEHLPCTVIDPLKALYYDLSILEGNIAFVNSSDKTAEYQFSVCAPLQKSNCTKSGTGVCKYVKGKNTAVSKGQANAKLMWKRQFIYLNYTDGVACGKNQRSYTIIIFKCSHTNNTVSIDDHDPCAAIITWTSSMVCKNIYELERLIDSLQFENVLNWKLLSRYHRNYVVQDKSNTTQYHLNVDIPLVKDQFTICTNGTGVCKVVIDNEGRKISELNLGYQDSDTHITENGDMYLIYLNGSICEEDSNKRISTKVTFTCDVEANAVRRLFSTLDNHYPAIEFFVRLLKTIQGTPKFKRYSNCEYYFDWSTSIACILNTEEMSSGCLTQNTLENFNFTYLIKKSFFKVNEDKSSGYFSARYCEDKNICNGSFLCQNWFDSGKDLKTKLDFAKPLIAFKFANESQCKKDIHYNNVINKWCELWTGIGELFLVKEKECSIGLDWGKYISDCHLKGNGTEGEKENGSTHITPNDTANILPNDRRNIHPTDIPYEPTIDIAFIETASLATLIMLILVVLLALGVVLYRWNKKRMVSVNASRNHSVRYRTMRRESEPIVDVDVDVDVGVDVE